MVDGVGGEIKHKFLELLGVLFKNSFQTFRSSIINTIVLIVVFVGLNGTEGLKKPGNDFDTDLATDIVPGVSF